MFKINNHDIFLDFNIIKNKNRKIEIISTELENMEAVSGLIELAKKYPELKFYLAGEMSMLQIASLLLKEC
jgi:hypothetical protein